MGSPASLELETLEGEPVTLAPKPGRALVVHFWATWCSSCVDELPALSRAVATCEDSVDVAIVDVGEKAGEIRDFLDVHGIALEPLRDPRGRVWRDAVGGRGLPANLVWTAGGTRRTEVGPRAPERWRELLVGLGCSEAGR